MSLAARLRTIRERRDYTVAELAHAAGMEPSAVHHIEAGRREDLKADTIRRLSKALDVSADWLLELGNETTRLG